MEDASSSPTVPPPTPPPYPTPWSATPATASRVPAPWRSARAGRLINLTGPLAVRTRDALIRAVLRGLDGIADWQPPGAGADPDGPYASPARTVP